MQPTEESAPGSAFNSGDRTAIGIVGGLILFLAIGVTKYFCELQHGHGKVPTTKPRISGMDLKSIKVTTTTEDANGNLTTAEVQTQSPKANRRAESGGSISLQEITTTGGDLLP